MAVLLAKRKEKQPLCEGTLIESNGWAGKDQDPVFKGTYAAEKKSIKCQLFYLHAIVA